LHHSIINDAKRFKLFSLCQCYKTFLYSSLAQLPNKLQKLSILTIVKHNSLFVNCVTDEKKFYNIDTKKKVSIS
jgi:hypothetical protein